MTVIIRPPELAVRDGKLLYRVPVMSSAGQKTLWFCLSEMYSDLVSERSDAALAALLIPAMFRGEDIQIGGTVSERLFYNLSGPCQTALKQIMPSLHSIEISPSDIQPATMTGRGVAMGFSGGIDSFCTLADHYLNDVPAGFRITHLLFNNVGSHEPGEKGRQLFWKRYERLKPVADRFGLPFIAIDSNMDSFYDTLLFEQTHTQRNASVALLLQQGIRRFLYASGFHYSSIFIGPATTMGYSDPVILPLLSTEAIDMISSGSEYTRVDKTLKVAKVAESYDSLDVCVNTKSQKKINCSSCYKCMRTMLTLEIAGVLERYSGVFDLPRYYRSREWYIAEVLCSRDPLLREIAAFMKSSGFHLPLPSRLLARPLLLSVAKRIRHGAGRTLRAFTGEKQ